jgi:hypothetical protein
MLFNPTWAKTPSLEGFIAWLETKDPEERYDWLSFSTCACGQYMRSLGLKIPTRYPGARYAGIADRFSAIARGKASQTLGPLAMRRVWRGR